MHRCLEIQEIVSLICKQLSAEDTTVSDNASLAAFAMTCRDFQEPALDVLWYRQTSLIPLVKCFPSDSWELRDEEGVPTLHFCRVPLPQDWPRVLRHAARIRYLEIPDRSVPLQFLAQFQFAPVGVWRVLEFYKPERPTYLFPNLLSVTLSERNASFPHCKILVGPTITRLELFVFGDAQRVSFLISLKEFCPHLTTLSIVAPIQTRGTDPVQKMAIIRGISNAVLQWNNLWRLDTSSLASDAFAHIADMTSLTKLWLSGSSTIDGLLIRPKKTFPSLVVFGCEGPDLYWVGSLFQTMDSPFLRNVSIFPFGHGSSSLWVRACAALHTFSINLESLHIEERDAPLDNDDDYSVGRDLLSLPVFQNLAIIFLNPWGGFDIDNQILQDASAGWPRVESLTLGIKGPWVRPSRITLSGLIPLLLQCPYLKALGIVFDATVFDHLLDMPQEQGVHNSKITTLEVGSSQIRKFVDVAMVLSSILPCISKINTWMPPQNPGQEDIARRDAWNQVATNIGVFALAEEAVNIVQ